MFWYQYTKAQILNELNSDEKNGLSKTEVASRLLKFGPNQLLEASSESVFKIFFRQFENPLIYILFVCAVIVFYLNERVDAYIILAVLLFNAVIGFLQEDKSQKTLKSLKKLSEAESLLLRESKEVLVPEKEIVPGDILFLQEGEKITADSRIILSSSLSVDESALTGESGSVFKRDTPILEGNLPASGQHNMVFKGTAVLSGSAVAVVVGTGQQTEIGKISKALLGSDTEIPLQKNIKKLSRLIIFLVFIISIALFFLGISVGKPVREIFAVVVSLAVSIIPEGLPLVLTLILVSGVWRMSKKNALVKKLQAVEALGHANILAVDKTGTITKNEMVIKKLFLSGKIYQVSGSGYEPKGSISLAGIVQDKNSPDLNMAATIACLVSRAKVVYMESEGVFRVSGDPTEAAMTVFAEKFSQLKEELLQSYSEIAEITFDHKNKYHTIFYEHGEGIFASIAGAPESLLDVAGHILENGQSRKITAQEKNIIESSIEEFSAQGMRVVAFGFKHLNKGHALDNILDMTFAGLFAIEDSVRPEALQSIKLAKSAGLKVVMITGDHKVTAKSIAKEAGIFEEGDLIITGAELSQLNEKTLGEKLLKVSVFARVTPEDKMFIIRAYKNAGHVIAMTGDGVNDAPSLVAADLGVSMGKIGTEVAKDASDIVLLDDNLKSIVAAIEEGRVMYKSIQKALLFLFSTSLGELLTVVISLVLGMPLPLLAVQILWLNLVTDPLIGAALAMDGKEPGLLKDKIKLPKYFLTKTMLVQMTVMGVVMALGSLFLFKEYSFDYSKSLTMCLTILAVFQWYNGYNCEFMDKTIFSKAIFRNRYLIFALLGNFALQLFAVYSPFMQKVLKTTPLSLGEWLVILIFGLSIIAAEEIRKLVYRLFAGHHTNI